MKVIKVTGNLSISCHRWVPHSLIWVPCLCECQGAEEQARSRTGGPGHADHSCLTLADLEPRLFPGRPLSGCGGGGGHSPGQDPGEDIPAPQHPVPEPSLHIWSPEPHKDRDEPGIGEPWHVELGGALTLNRTTPQGGAAHPPPRGPHQGRVQHLRPQGNSLSPALPCPPLPPPTHPPPLLGGGSTPKISAVLPAFLHHSPGDPGPAGYVWPLKATFRPHLKEGTGPLLGRGVVGRGVWSVCSSESGL